MKILIVGPWRWPVYEEAFERAFRKKGIMVLRLPETDFFRGRLGYLQCALPLPGLAMVRLNQAVVKKCEIEKPDLTLFWRPTHIFPFVLRHLSKLGIKCASYNNDDPFGPKIHGNVPRHHHLKWYWYIKCLPWFVYNFFYRRVNCIEAIAYGAKHTEVLMPYFRPWQDRPLTLTEEEKKRYNTDIVFAGHYEPDGREKSIRALISAGLRVKIWGGHYWNRSVLGDIYDKLSPVSMAEGDDYTKALCGAKVCLAFLSKMNRDTFTRRCFEIPACGRVMLAERTEDLVQMYEEDKEACFFSSTEELVNKAKWLINNPGICERIAKAGMKRVWDGGHDVDSRVNNLLDSLCRNDELCL